jgi:hypothetical protein
VIESVALCSLSEVPGSVAAWMGSKAASKRRKDFMKGWDEFKVR